MGFTFDLEGLSADQLAQATATNLRGGDFATVVSTKDFPGRQPPTGGRAVRHDDRPVIITTPPSRWGGIARVRRRLPPGCLAAEATRAPL
ncbi:hypothetical protein GCM10009660_38830 [Catellatospora bangladeshensis]